MSELKGTASIGEILMWLNRGGYSTWLLGSGRNRRLRVLPFFVPIACLCGAYVDHARFGNILRPFSLHFNWLSLRFCELMLRELSFMLVRTLLTSLARSFITIIITGLHVMDASI